MISFLTCANTKTTPPPQKKKSVAGPVCILLSPLSVRILRQKCNMKPLQKKKSPHAENGVRKWRLAAEGASVGGEAVGGEDREGVGVGGVSTTELQSLHLPPPTPTHAEFSQTVPGIRHPNTDTHCLTRRRSPSRTPPGRDDGTARCSYAPE